MAQPIAQPSQGPRRSHQRNRSTTAVPTDAAKVASKSMAVGPRQICLSARAAPWQASERGQRARVHALSARYRCTLTTSAMPPPHRQAGASLPTPGRRRVRLFMTHDDMSRSSSSRDARGRRIGHVPRDVHVAGARPRALHIAQVSLVPPGRGPTHGTVITCVALRQCSWQEPAVGDGARRARTARHD